MTIDNQDEAETPPKHDEEACNNKDDFQVSPDEYNFENHETGKYFMEEIVVTLKICKAKGSPMEKNIFKCADFWLSKGILIQTKGKADSDESKDSNNAALDYYLSGVKIDPRHFGCVYNVACSYYFEKKYVNANKWFDIAIKLDPLSEDSYFGKTIACLKLGLFDDALATITKLEDSNEQMTTSELYKPEQFTLLNAICNRIVCNHS